MARLELSPSVRAYLEAHAVDPELAHELGVRSAGDVVLYTYTKPRGEPFTRRRDLNDERKITKQPSGEPLVLWWPAGRPDPGVDVLLTEGEPDALAAVSALNGDPFTVAATPGTTIPPERVTAELGTARCVFLAMDGDEAGRKAANRFARALQEFTEIRVVRLGRGEDLASRLYRESSRRAWLLEALNSAPAAPRVKVRSEDGGYRRKKADRTRELLARGIDPDRLELAGLLDEVAEFIRSFIVLPVVPWGDQENGDLVAHLLALWMMHTWCFAACFATPYLRVVSAAPVSAKSLLLEVLASVSRRGWLVVNPSPAILYRKIDRDQPTVLLDELDNFDLSEKRDALAVLNSGYKAGAKVPRCNERGQLEEFACFCPKAYAGLDERQLVPTLLSRSITIRMETKRPSDPVEMWIAPDVEPRASDLRSRCEAWADRHIDEVRRHRPDLLGLANRQAEVWWILLTLGELASEEWTERARTAARVLGAGGDETDRPADQLQLLMDIDAGFGNDTTIFTVDLLKHLNELEESPWGDRRRGDGLDARGLARLLRPFKIRPKEVRVGAETARGYHVDQFADAFARYLPTYSEAKHGRTSATSAPLTHGDVSDVSDVRPSEGTEGRTRQMDAAPSKDESWRR